VPHRSTARLHPSPAGHDRTQLHQPTCIRTAPVAAGNCCSLSDRQTLPYLERHVHCCHIELCCGLVVLHL
jgi:hypothetical protein